MPIRMQPRQKAQPIPPKADTARMTARPPISRRREAIALGLDLLLGAACALGQVPWNLWPLSLLALGAILWRVSGAAGPARAGLRAGAAGAGYFALAMSWITEPFFVQPEIYGWMAPFAMIIFAIGGAMFWIVPAWLAARAAPDRQARIMAFAAGMVLSDWLRGWIFTGLPWALLGHIWIETPVAQMAAWIGAVGLSTITLTVAALPLILAHPAAPDLRRGLTGIALSLALIALFWLAGLSRLQMPVEPGDVTLRLVQPNADQALKWDPAWAQTFWERLLSESAAPSETGPPDAVIWPETAVGFLLNNAGEALPVLSDAAKAPVLMGIQRAEGQRYYNSLIEVAPGGSVAAIYDKFHLVPFGEYIPWGDLMARFGIGAFAARQGFGYTPGPGPGVMTPAGLPPVQPLICYEAIFPQHLRAVQGAEWLLQITNDSWFGTRSGPYQHLALARLRSIESGLPLMRAANTGITAAIDPLGRVTAEIPLGVQGHIDPTLPEPLPQTVWTRFGPWPVVILSLAVLLLASGRRRRA